MRKRLFTLHQNGGKAGQRRRTPCARTTAPRLLWVKEHPSGSPGLRQRAGGLHLSKHACFQTTQAAFEAIRNPLRQAWPVDQAPEGPTSPASRLQKWLSGCCNRKPTSSWSEKLPTSGGSSLVCVCLQKSNDGTPLAQSHMPVTLWCLGTGQQQMGQSPLACHHSPHPNCGSIVLKRDLHPSTLVVLWAVLPRRP